MSLDLCFFYVGSDLPRGSHETAGAWKAASKQSSVTAVVFPTGWFHDTQVLGSELMLNSLQLDQVVAPQATLLSTNAIQDSICMAFTPALAPFRIRWPPKPMETIGLLQCNHSQAASPPVRSSYEAFSSGAVRRRAV